MLGNPSTGTQPGALDLYRVVARSADARLGPLRAALVAEAAFIGLFVLLEAAQASRPAWAAWTLLLGGLALAAPTSGLVVLAAIAPFGEPWLITSGLGPKPLIGVAVLLGVALRVAAGLRARPWTGWLAGAWRTRRWHLTALASALVVLAGTGLGLVQTALGWGRSYALAAGQLWLSGIGVGLLVLFAAAWVARDGERRALAVALASAVIATLVSLVDFWQPGSLASTPLGWAIVGTTGPGRLGGVIRSPTSMAALASLPTMVLLAAALLGRGWRRRAAAAGLAAPLLVALYLTYNRAVFLALFAFVAILAFRYRRALGVAFVAAGLVVGAALLPAYLSLRSDAVGGSSQVQANRLLVASDQQRIQAWQTASRLWLDSPLTGYGYRSFRQLSDRYGETPLDAPHDEWLRLFAEDGVLVGLAGAWFVAATTLALASGRGWLATGLLAAFVSLALAASFNNPFLFDQVTIAGFVVTGSALAMSWRGDEPDAATAG